MDNLDDMMWTFQDFTKKQPIQVFIEKKKENGSKQNVNVAIVKLSTAKVISIYGLKVA